MSAQENVLSSVIQEDWIEILSALFNTCKVSSTAAAILLYGWDLWKYVNGENELFSAWVLKHWPDILNVDLENLTDAEGSQYSIELIQALLNTSKVSREVALGLCAALLSSISQNEAFTSWFNKIWPENIESGEDDVYH